MFLKSLITFRLNFCYEIRNNIYPNYSVKKCIGIYGEYMENYEKYRIYRKYGKYGKYEKYGVSIEKCTLYGRSLNYY